MAFHVIVLATTNVLKAIPLRRNTDVAKIDITINTNSWPKLQMVISANDEFGRPILVDSKERYDLAYTKFENDLHNVLRPIVESVVKSKTRGQ